MKILIVSYVVLGLLALGLLLALLKSKVTKRRRLKTTLVPLLIVVPQGIVNPLAKHGPSEIELSIEFYKRLLENKIPFVLEVAVHGVGEEVNFYISVPEKSVYTTAKLIESLWSDGYATTADDYNLWISGSNKVSSAYLSQKKPYSIPLRKVKLSENELFQPMLKYLSNLRSVGEGAIFQWIVHPAHPKLVHDVSRLLKKMKFGKYDGSKHVHEDFVLSPDNVKRLEDKIKSPLVAVNARAITVAKTQERSQEILDGLMDILEKIPSSSSHNELRSVSKKKEAEMIDSFLTKEFHETQEMVLNVSELASLFHFPGANTAIPKIRRK